MGIIGQHLTGQARTNKTNWFALTQARWWARLNLLIALVAVFFAGVDWGAHPTRAQDSASTIIIGVTDLPETLDPGEAYDFAAWEVLSHLYTGLTRQIPGTVDYELALARAVQVSDDRLTYSFTLRNDAAFADGTPITAQTFVESIERVLALEGDAAQAVMPYVARMEAAESGDLVFTLTRPVPCFMALVALPPYFPQHPDLTRTDRAQPTGTGMIGNGPYQLAEFTPGEQIVLHANPAYTLGPPPATPVIVLRRYDRSEDLRNAIRAHTIDVAWRALFTGHLIELETDAPNGLQFVETPSTRVFYMLFNRDREPFSEPSAREAITLLVERAPLASEFERGHMSPLTSLIPPVFADAYAPIWPDAFALDRAETLLQAAGYRTRGQAQLQFDVGYSLQTYGLAHLPTFTQLVERGFTESDYISARLVTDIETPALIRALERGELNTGAVIFAWTPIVPHPAAYLRPLAHTDEPIPSAGGCATPAFSRLLDDAARLDDPVAQGSRYREAAGQLLADRALIPLFQDHVALVAWDTIGGIQVEPNYFLHYDQLTKDGAGDSVR
jgi:ABC-type transport system substrate-binding protein